MKQETKEKISKTLFGHIILEEVKLKISCATKEGLKNSERFQKYLAHIKIPLESRNCACGCSSVFICKINSEKKYIWGHNMTGKKRRHSQLTKEKISETITNKYLAHEPVGKYHKSKSGYFFSNRIGKKIFYKSLWELSFLEKIEESQIIRTFVAEPFSISYEYKGAVHKYIPDFLVIYKTGQIILFEIKPEFRIRSDPQTRAKLRAGEEWCKRAGIKFVTLTGERTIYNEKNIGTKAF